MSNNQITKEEIEKLMEIPGKVRGVVFQTDAGYIKNSQGEDGLKAVKEELQKLGCLIDYEKIKAMEWYPLGLRVISLLVIKKVFNLTDEDIEKMGNAAPKYSFIVKLLMKYFLSFPRSYKETPKYWKKHYTVGVLEAPEYDMKKKYSITRIKNFNAHPVLCRYLAGYFTRIGQYVLKTKKFSIEETKCMFKGDPYHEYIFRWE